MNVLKEQGLISSSFLSFDYDEKNANNSMITFGRSHDDLIGIKGKMITIDNFGGHNSWALDLEAI